MQIEYRKSDAGTTIFLFGEIDHHNAKDINAKIDKIIESEMVVNLALDFEKVTFMDSSGIAVVLGRYRKIEDRGGKITVIRTNPLIRKIFILSGLDKLLDIS